MGKVHSLFEISGKVGDYVFYELNGQQVIRKAPSKKKGPKTEAQKSVALQNTEFGKASSAGKMLRVALAEECSQLHDRYLYQRVSKLMLRLKSCDGAPIGSRTVQGGLTTAEGQAALANFHFQKVQKNFPQLLNAVYRQGNLCLSLFFAKDADFAITELQINFETRKFRRYKHGLPEVEKGTPFSLKKGFRHKKGFTDLLMISGAGFLQGVVVTADRNK
ncbi:hypothetical protein [Chryseobacterium sp. MDT2-18]|uniref:hypothetical protein n=1 Tax=Chryseobacterium sp. MDT2-18 TaxID=1259136 RepID=UPI0027864327|nr:hypothetical protein [Chryseobacterium sp. MDT2-18]MDQ0475589.1 hypothetical protein [Chryseobacterium sp. MDT2-18]